MPCSTHLHKLVSSLSTCYFEDETAGFVTFSFTKLIQTESIHVVPGFVLSKYLVGLHAFPELIPARKEMYCFHFRTGIQEDKIVVGNTERRDAHSTCHVSVNRLQWSCATVNMKGAESVNACLWIWCKQYIVTFLHQHLPRSVLLLSSVPPLVCVQIQRGQDYNTSTWSGRWLMRHVVFYLSAWAGEKTSEVHPSIQTYERARGTYAWPEKFRECSRSV